MFVMLLVFVAILFLAFVTEPSGMTYGISTARQNYKNYHRTNSPESKAIRCIQDTVSKGLTSCEVWGGPSLKECLESNGFKVEETGFPGRYCVSGWADEM